MSGSVRELSTRARLQTIAGSISGHLSSMSPVDRAAVLVLTNHMLDIVGRTWGEELRDSPATAHPRAADAALASLAEAQDAMVETSKWTGSDPATLRQWRSIDLVKLTVGHPRLPSAYPVLGQAWRSVWLARPHMGEALLSMRDWERATGVDAFPLGPDGRRQTDAQILAAAARFPKFFRGGGQAA